ncbi:MAG: carbon storage regulator [Desulfobacterales bacterium]|nr:carbon storage regulator [Desulfobacterales bacterium]
MVVAIRGKQVRLGIETPPDLLVWRGEKGRQAEPNRAR